MALFFRNSKGAKAWKEQPQGSAALGYPVKDQFVTL
jgi:hypothetical protein